MKNIPIGIKLLGGFMALLILVCAGLGFIAYDRSSRAVLGQVEENIVLMAEDGSRYINSRLDYYLLAVEGVANRHVIRSMEWFQQRPALEAEVARLGYQQMAVATPDGNARLHDGTTANISDRDYFKQAMSGQAVISNVIIHRILNMPIMVVAAPIWGDSRQVAGVIFAVLDAGILSQYTDNIKYGQTGYSYIIDNTGALIAHGNRQFVLDQRNFIQEARTNSQYAPLAAMFQRMVRGETGFDAYPFMGADRFFGFAPIAGTGWSIAVGAMRDDVLAPVYQLRWAIGIASVVFFGLGIVIALLVSRTITVPVNRLMAYAEDVTHGDLQAQSGIDQKDEIGRLAQSISSMVENLKDKSYWYESMLDAIPFPVSVTDTELRWTFINKAAIEVTGKQREEILGKQCRDWGADICGTDRCGVECLKRGQSTSWFTQPVLGRDFQVDAAYLTDRTGACTGHIEVVQDVTEANRLKRQAEQALKNGMFQAATSIEDVVERMTSASEQLAAQVEQASRGAEEQKSRAAETATAMEEMNATVLEVAKNASHAAEGSDKARAKAEDGADIVKESVQSINQVEQQAHRLKDDLARLGQQAEQIGKIMTVIDDIADQTNLLALNAAIEAARAGDAGRGFAVVADEVRKLAEKTMHATKEVGDAITAIQESTKINIEGMEQAVTSVGQATSQASKSGDALQLIVSLAEQSADQVRSIATAAEEQSSASEEISRSVEDITRISFETSEVMEQSAQAISDLARQAVELQSLVQKLKQD